MLRETLQDMLACNALFDFDEAEALLQLMQDLVAKYIERQGVTHIDDVPGVSLMCMQPWSA